MYAIVINKYSHQKKKRKRNNKNEDYHGLKDIAISL